MLPSDAKPQTTSEVLLREERKMHFYTDPRPSLLWPYEQEQREAVL